MAPPRKREDQMLGRPKRVGPQAEQLPLDAAASHTVLPVPNLIVADPHPIVQAFWDSLRVSPMRTYFQETDWAAAQMAAYLMQGICKPFAGKGPSAQMVAEVNRIFDSLGMTEIQRRKGGIEIERREDDTEELADIENEYREMLGM